MARSIGDILLQVDDEHMADAEIWIRKAIEADTRNGTQWFLPLIMPSMPTGSKRREIYQTRRSVSPNNGRKNGPKI